MTIATIITIWIISWNWKTYRNKFRSWKSQ